MGLLGWLWYCWGIALGIAVVLLWDSCEIAVGFLLWYGCEIAVGLLWDSCGIAVGLPRYCRGIAVKLLWY